MSIRTWIADKICGIETMIPGTEDYYFWRTEQQFAELAEVCSKFRVNTEEIDRLSRIAQRIAEAKTDEELDEALKEIHMEEDDETFCTMNFIDAEGQIHTVECKTKEDFDEAFMNSMGHEDWALLL